MGAANIFGGQLAEAVGKQLTARLPAISIASTALEKLSLIDMPATWPGAPTGSWLCGDGCPRAQDRYVANQSSTGPGRCWNSRYPSNRAVVFSIQCSFLSVTGMLSNIACTSLGWVRTSSRTW